MVCKMGGLGLKKFKTSWSIIIYLLKIITFKQKTNLYSS